MDSVSNIFTCNECGNDILEYKGIVFFAGLVFECYLCEKCGDKILLEKKATNSLKISGNLAKKCMKLT